MASTFISDSLKVDLDQSIYRPPKNAATQNLDHEHTEIYKVNLNLQSTSWGAVTLLKRTEIYFLTVCMYKTYRVIRGDG